MHGGYEGSGEDVERTVEAVIDVTPAALTPERRRTLEAVVRRVLPSAADTDVAVAIEGTLQHRSWRAMRPWIDRALDELQSRAGAREEREFCAATPDTQDDLLRALECDPHPVLRVVFRSLVVLSLEGLLGDPMHGGNRDFRGWEAIGLRPGDVRSGMCRSAGEPDGRS